MILSNCVLTPCLLYLHVFSGRDDEHIDLYASIFALVYSDGGGIGKRYNRFTDAFSGIDLIIIKKDRLTRLCVQK